MMSQNKTVVLNMFKTTISNRGIIYFSNFLRLIRNLTSINSQSNNGHKKNEKMIQSVISTVGLLFPTMIPVGDIKTTATTNSKLKKKPR